MSARKGNILLPLISAVAIVAVIAAGYFFYVSQLLRNDLNTETQRRGAEYVQSHSQEPQVETGNPDSIGANWKTYTNSALGFAIKLPLDLEKARETTTTIDFATTPSMKEPYIRITSNVTNLEKTDVCRPGDVSDCIWAIDFVKMQKYTETYLDNRKAIKFELWTDRKYTVVQTTVSPQLEIRFLSSERYYNPAIFDQILSTFKFL